MIDLLREWCIDDYEDATSATYSRQSSAQAGKGPFEKASTATHRVGRNYVNLAMQLDGSSPRRHRWIVNCRCCLEFSVWTPSHGRDVMIGGSLERLVSNTNPYKGYYSYIHGKDDGV